LESRAITRTIASRNDTLKIVTGQTPAIAAGLTPCVALYTVLPADDGTGGTEVTGGGYARVNSSGKWSTPSAGVGSNSSTIDFGTSSASWGTIVGWAIMTASSGGTMLRKGPVTPNVSVPFGTPVSFPAGSLQLSDVS
jgi:hypothetical protein